MVRHPFQAPRLTAILLVPLMVGLAALWIRFTPEVKPEAPLRLRLELPSRLDGYTSSIHLHCQNPRCRRAFVVREADRTATCESCGSPLLPVSLAEHDVLPADTTIIRRIYEPAIGPGYTVTIVLAGSDPRSIHQPQQCLPSQGYRIDRQQARTLRLASGRELKLMTIDGRTGQGSASRFAFVFWYVGPNHETPYNFVRLLRTLQDQLFRNTFSRWAYVSVIVGEPLDTPESLARLSLFMDKLLPEIETQPPATP